MKKITTLILICLTSTLSAQFSGDPVNPFYVCNATSTQSNVTALSDGNGGYYTFWLDKRVNGSDNSVYGQHLDATGHELWTTNGKPIVQTVKSATAYRVTRVKNKILVTWMQEADSILCKLIDSNGNDVWAQPTVVAKVGGGIIYMQNSGFNVFENDSGATITFSYIYTGGSSLFGFNRVDDNGILQWPINNFVLPTSGYDYRTQQDGLNGFYLLGKGNGLGSGFYMQHYNLQGIASWPAFFEITGGGGLNGLGGNINMHNDADGNLYVVWDANNGRTLATKVTLQGNHGWSPNRIELSSIVNSQSRCNSLLWGNRLYAIWNDSRVSGNSDLYMQMIDTAGTPAWTINGIFVAEQNYYYNYAKLAYSDSNTVVAFYLGLTDLSTYAQRIHLDSTLSWPGNGIELVATPSSWISYSDAVAISDSNGCNALFYAATNGNVIGTKLCGDGVLVKTNELSQPGFEMYPNPAYSVLNFNFENESLADQINIYSIRGELLQNHQVNQSVNKQVDISQLSPGMYIVAVIKDGISSNKKLIVQ